jgi:hypothetical protein
MLEHPLASIVKTSRNDLPAHDEGRIFAVITSFIGRITKLDYEDLAKFVTLNECASYRLLDFAFGV